MAIRDSPDSIKAMKLPDLHRVVDHKADWEGIPVDELNAYQLRAIETYGLDTPGNRETLKGAVASWLGVELIERDMFVAGSALLGWGRMKDLQDGKIADATKTKSPLGAAFDALVDGALLARAVPVLEKKGILSSTESTAVLSTLAVKAAATTIGTATGKRMNASRTGKTAGFLIWTGIGSRLVGAIARDHSRDRLSKPLTSLGNVLLITGVGAAGLAGLDYARQAIATSENE